MRRALLLHNALAGRHKPPGLVTSVVAALGTGGYEVEPAAVRTSDDAVQVVRSAADAGVDAVFALGGDGTVRDAATGLVGRETCLGILPAGTTNVVARALGLPLGAVAAARALCDAPPVLMDVGLCGERPFLMQATAGFDAAVLAVVDRRLKARLGRFGIALQGLGLWWRYEFPLLELRIDGQPRQATQIAVANIAEYGGSFRLVPKGMWDDHQLDVVLFHGRGRRAMLSFYVDIVRGVHAQRPDVEILPATNVDLLGPMGSAVQIDGDVVSEPLPLSVRLARARLRVLQPET
jgi:YegS/Rv2252/BmrU family lipid kinase